MPQRGSRGKQKGSGRGRRSREPEGRFDLEFFRAEGLYVGALAGRLIYVKLDSKPNVINDVRLFIEAYCRARYGALMAESVGLSAQELLENAVTHGLSSSSVELTFMEDSGSGALQVYVENAAIPSRLERLARRLAEIQGMGAQQAYQSALRDTMKVRRDTAMLGLARLAHEAKVSLTMRTTGDRVTVCATTAPWRVTGHFRART